MGGTKELMRSAEVVTEQMRLGGIHVTPKPISQVSFSDAFLLGQYEVAASFCPGDIDPPRNLDL